MIGLCQGRSDLHQATEIRLVGNPRLLLGPLHLLRRFRPDGHRGFDVGVPLQDRLGDVEDHLVIQGPNAAKWPKNIPQTWSFLEEMHGKFNGNDDEP